EGVVDLGQMPFLKLGVEGRADDLDDLALFLTVDGCDHGNSPRKTQSRIRRPALISATIFRISLPPPLYTLSANRFNFAKSICSRLCSTMLTKSPASMNFLSCGLRGEIIAAYLDAIANSKSGIRCDFSTRTVYRNAALNRSSTGRIMSMTT